MTNTGDDSHGNIRSDFPGGWSGDSRNGFAGLEIEAESVAFQEEMRALLQWRKTAHAIHHGQLMHYVPEAGSYVYFRYDESQTFMVILNQSEQAETLDLERFDEVLKGRRVLRNVLSGSPANDAEASLTVPAHAAWVLEVE